MPVSSPIAAGSIISVLGPRNSPVRVMLAKLGLLVMFILCGKLSVIAPVDALAAI